jgi:hypothetical protein
VSVVSVMYRDIRAMLESRFNIHIHSIDPGPNLAVRDNFGYGETRRARDCNPRTQIDA